MYIQKITKNFVWACITNSYIFVDGTKIIKFKAKDYKIVATPFCRGNISKDFSVDNMKKTGLNGYVSDLVLIMMLLIYCDQWYIRHAQVFDEKE